MNVLIWENNSIVLLDNLITGQVVYKKKSMFGIDYAC